MCKLGGEMIASYSSVECDRGSRLYHPTIYRRETASMRNTQIAKRAVVSWHTVAICKPLIQ